MGIAVTEEELRLYMLCANRDRIDADKLASLVTVQPGAATARRKEKPKPQPQVSDDEFDFEQSVRAAAPKETRRAPKLSSVLGMNKAKPRPAEPDSSDDEGVDTADKVRDEVARRLHAVEWQHLHSDIVKLIRLTGSHIKPPKQGTPITDMRRIKDYLAREYEVPMSVDNTLNFFLSIAPMVEAFVVTNLPLVNLQGWADVVTSLRDVIRGPLESVYRTHMLSFGVAMSPSVTLVIIVLGSMAITAGANYFGKNPVTMTNTILRTMGGVVGVMPTSEPVRPEPARPKPARSVPEADHTPGYSTSRPTMPPP